jgi:hypothetical protein
MSASPAALRRFATLSLGSAFIAIALLFMGRAQTSQALSAGSRISWQGKSWYLQGANLPWYNWSCDFGCGSSSGVSNSGVSSNLATTFAQAQASGVHVVRWWMFEGSPWQITKDGSGAPSGVDPRVYTDIDAALQLAQKYDIYFDFVLFSAPSAVPSAWLTDASQQAKLASVIGKLAGHYTGNSRVLSWEVFNEPDFDIWNNKVAQAPVQGAVKAIASAVHANSTAYVTVGSGMLDGLPMWVGLGLDYYQAHWYDYMNQGNYDAMLWSYADVKARYKLDAPLVIGEFYASTSVNALSRDNYWYDKGYAGSWAWSLLPSHTYDGMSIDLAAAKTFLGQHSDLGPLASGGAGAAAPLASPTAAPPTATPSPTRTPSPTPAPVKIASPTPAPTKTATPPAVNAPSSKPVPAACTNPALKAGPASPQKTGTVVTLTATASCGGTAQYEFWVGTPAGVWSVVRAYSTGSTFSWTTAGLPRGTYTLSVHVRNVGSTVPQDSYVHLMDTLR